MGKSYLTLSFLTTDDVLSPIIFTIYMDVLLNRLQQNGVGCYIEKNFYGAFGYADDLALICPSVKGFQNML